MLKKLNLIIAGILTIAAVSFLYGCSKKDDASAKNNTTIISSNNNSPEEIKNPNNTSSPSNKPEHLTAKTFKEKVFNYDTNKDWKYEGSTPCIVDFYADWCKPCKILSPILEEIAAEYGDRLIVYKVNTDEEQELSSAFGITSIPSLLFVPGEGKPQMTTGALPKEELIKIINQFLVK